MRNLIILLLLFLSSCGKDTTIVPNGKSGSLAKMISVGDYLYVIDVKDLKTFDISDNLNPIQKSVVDVGLGIETIFPFANYLFIGSREGLYIYDISNPEKPVEASAERVEHFTSCDPVVANNNYAYVTLSSVSVDCRVGELNELQVVDIQDIFKPVVIKKIPMQGPKGLGLDGDKLFICDSDLGVVVFDLLDPDAPTVITTLSGFTANDVIVDNGRLLVVCDDGLRQFNYTNIDSIYQISHLSL